MQTVEHVDFTELVQFHALRENPTVLTVESCGSRRGWIWLAGGNVVKAETAGGKTGVNAFVEIMAWHAPAIAKLEETTSPSPDIDIALPQLLLEAYWRSENYEPSDPELESLEEDTVTGDADVEPPDGVTNNVLGLARMLREIEGSLGLILLANDGREVERLGPDEVFTVPNFVRTAVRGMARRRFHHSMFSSRNYIDVLIPPLPDTDIAFLVRVDRTQTNRGRIEVELRRITSKAAA